MNAPFLSVVIPIQRAQKNLPEIMQRLAYISIAPPQTARQVEEIAADNAVYRRSDILQHQDLLQKGYWEPSFHARFRAAGWSLALEPRLRVVHRNRYNARQFLGQRFAHGREFGHARAARLQWFGCILLIRR